jgi:hypothetical protein
MTTEARRWWVTMSMTTTMTTTMTMTMTMTMTTTMTMTMTMMTAISAATYARHVAHARVLDGAPHVTQMPVLLLFEQLREDAPVRRLRRHDALALHSGAPK